MQFLRYLVGRGPRKLEWQPGTRRDGKKASVLVLEDNIPHLLHRESRRPSWLVTSRAVVLQQQDFGPVAGAINAVAAKGHCRTITVLDPDGQPLAALSFHLPKSNDMLLVGAIATLIVGRDAERQLSLVMAGLLLCYLSWAARAKGLPASIGFAPGPAAVELAKRLDFRPQSPPAVYAQAGASFRTWTPPR